MMLTIEYFLLAAAGLLLLSVLASKAFGRMGIPALLLFLGIGMLAGSDGPGGIHFDNPWLAQSLGVVALTFILFAGGMDTEWASVRRVLGIGISLSTVGVAVTAGLVGWFAIPHQGPTAARQRRAGRPCPARRVGPWVRTPAARRPVGGWPR